ncbi:maleylpyruvate isomerase family mycothiol-dependent enzyme [Herbidospora sp. RD11066]
MSEIADRYARLASDFTSRIVAVPDHLWGAVSPCRGWTARDVVAHVVNGHRGIAGFVHGAPPAPAHGVGVSSMSGAPVVEPGADLAVAFGACRDDLLAVLRDPVLAATILPFSPIGPVPVERAVDVVGALELLGHTWDLARATGGDEILDEDAVIRTHQALLPHHAALLATGAFEAPVQGREDADPQTAFLRFTGRLG